MPLYPLFVQSIPQLAPYLSYPRWNPWCLRVSSIQLSAFVMPLIFVRRFILAANSFSFYTLISRSSFLLTCSLFSFFCRRQSHLQTSSILSGDSTSGALMLPSSSSFGPASFSQELLFSSSSPPSVVWLSSVGVRTKLSYVISRG